jgi:hypothetical protein
VRSASEVNDARKARQEQISLVLGRAVHKLIRSKRVVVAARMKLAASTSMMRKIR